MSTLSEVATHIAGLSISGVTSSSVFWNFEPPESPDVVVSLLGYPGGPPDLGFGFAGIAYEYAGVQFRVRGAPHDTQGPETMAHALYLKVAEMQGITISGTQYLMPRIASKPSLLETDEKGRKIFVFSCVFEKKPS